MPIMTADGAKHRLDKWLWYARFYKTRSLATAAISGGKVHLNAERVKPAHPVRIGDRITPVAPGRRRRVRDAGDSRSAGAPPRRRGPHYLETPASAARRAQLREQQRLAQLSRPRPETRPDKRDRRRLMRLHRDQL